VRHASISPQTVSAHLDKLFRDHLLAVEIQGRHHYYRLRSPQVAQLSSRLSYPGTIPRKRPDIHKSIQMRDTKLGRKKVDTSRPGDTIGAVNSDDN
jgi:DNA-binding transcriptional ArsR family regulator